MSYYYTRDHLGSVRSKKKQASFRVTYPTGTGLSTSYSYFGNTSSDSNPADDDQRLETIQNMHGTTQLSGKRGQASFLAESKTGG